MANVFASLNRFIARLDSDPQTITTNPKAPSHGPNAYGFQVLRNTNPELALEPWFDFIIGINGRIIDSGDPSLFATEVRNCAGSTISLGVYGIKGQQIREMYAAIPASADAGLGLALQWSPLSRGDDIWHILDVMPNSPADVAGLLPYSDYVIGSPDAASAGGLHGEPALGELVEAFESHALRLWVYNQEYDVTRLVTLTPSRNWGGQGILGCVLGFGALHRVPAPLTEPTQAPGETLFDSSPQDSGSAYVTANAQQGADFLVPANLEIAAPVTSTSPLHDEEGRTPPPPSGGAGKQRKQRAHHAIAPAAGLDDYFAEGEQKSRELDKGLTPKPSGTLPPPPRTGAPPKATSPAPGAEET